MGKWVDAKTRDGRAFKQWQRTSDTERAPERDDYCIFCGAVPYWKTIEREKANPVTRCYIDHDPVLHRWKLTRDDDEQSRELTLVKPKRSFFDDDD